MLAGAGFLTVMFLVPAHAVIMGTPVEHIGLLLGMANGCTVIGAILLHHFIKNYGHLNGMVLIHLLGGLSTSTIWYSAKDFNTLSIFTAIFCMSVGSIVPMYPMGKLEESEKESILLGMTQVIKWAFLTTAVAIPFLKVFYFEWAMNYLSTYWVKPAAILVTGGYVSATVGLFVLRFSMSPHLKAKL